MKEKQLRKIVKDIFEAGSNSHLGLQWVEPSQGSSVGMPDVYWPYRGQLIGVELKVFKDRMCLRPAQYAYHYNSWRDGIPSFVLAACVNCEGEYDVILFNGMEIRDYNKYNLAKKMSIKSHRGFVLNWPLLHSAEELSDACGFIERKIEDVLLTKKEKVARNLDHVWIEASKDYK